MSVNVTIPKPAAGILECPGTDDDGQTTAALSRQDKGITVVSGSERNVDLLPQNSISWEE